MGFPTKFPCPSALRPYRRFSIILPELHVLVGENGSGKTAVIEAINYATSSYYLASRLDEQDFNNADADPIKITVAFDKPFAVKIPDGYIHQTLLAQSVQLNAKRREKAARSKASSDPFVVSHLCFPITYKEKLEINGLSLARRSPLLNLFVVQFFWFGVTNTPNTPPIVSNLEACYSRIVSSHSDTAHFF